MKSRNLRPVSKLPVKLEIVEDFLEEENGPAHKRSKVCSFELISILLHLNISLLSCNFFF